MSDTLKDIFIITQKVVNLTTTSEKVCFRKREKKNYYRN